MSGSGHIGRLLAHHVRCVGRPIPQSDLAAALRGPETWTRTAPIQNRALQTAAELSLELADYWHEIDASGGRKYEPKTDRR